MNDQELDLAIAATSRYSSTAVAELDLAALEVELLERIMSGAFGAPDSDSDSESDVDGPDADADLDTVVPLERPGRTRPHPQRRRRRTTFVAMAVAACLVVVAGILATSPGGDRQFADAAIAVARSNERLLVDDPTWTVAKVDQFTAASGEMTFTGSGRELWLNWYPADTYEMFLLDRTSSYPSKAIAVLGEPATLVTYTGAGFAALLRPNDVNFLEIRSNDLVDEREFRALLAKLRRVGVDEWLTALPERAVRPDASAALIDSMLQGVVRPPVLDLSDVEAVGVSDRYQFGTRVASAVACGWFDDWFEASAVDDADRVAAAGSALRSLRDWKLLQDLDAEGDYSQVVWQLADRTQLPAGSEAGGLPLTAESVHGALTCPGPVPSGR